MADVATANFHGELTLPQLSSTTEAQGVNSDVEMSGEAAAEPVVATKTQRKATPKKAVPKKKENGVEPEEPTTPKPAKKRATPKAKKEKEAKAEAKVDAEDEDAAAGDDTADTLATPAALSSKKRAKAVKGDGEIDTPTKKRKTKASPNGGAETPAKTPKSASKATPKAKGKFPESFEEFSNGDKLLVRMKKEGKSWDEIEPAWTAVTGQIPGKDVLRKREAKLRALAIEWKAGDSRKLADFKAQVEKDKWAKISELFKSNGAEYSGNAVQKKWETMVKKGEVDADGKYIGQDVDAAEALEVQASTNGQVEEDGIAENEDAVEADAEAVENEEA